MSRSARVGLLVASVALQLLLAGCLGSGGSSGSGSSFLSQLFGGGSDSGGAQTSERGGANLIPEVVAHSPEPASLALFGGGLAGVAFLRRRKLRRRAPR